MDLDNLHVDDRIEIYTPSTGTYWGYITSIDITSASVTVNDISPNNGQPTTVPASAIVARRFRGRRPEGHVGIWNGN